MQPVPYIIERTALNLVQLLNIVSGLHTEPYVCFVVHNINLESVGTIV